jgi:hypothetical protein
MIQTSLWVLQPANHRVWHHSYCYRNVTTAVATKYKTVSSPPARTGGAINKPGFPRYTAAVFFNVRSAGENPMGKKEVPVGANLFWLDLGPSITAAFC